MNLEHTWRWQWQPQSWKSAVADSLVVLIVSLAYVLVASRGLQNRIPLSATPAGWSPSVVVDSDAPGATRYRREDQLTVRLPDSSMATVSVRGGHADALLLPPSNELADRRDRALQAGAGVDADQSVVLATVSTRGDHIDFAIRPDGDTQVQVEPRRRAAK